MMVSHISSISWASVSTQMSATFWYSGFRSISDSSISAILPFKVNAGRDTSVSESRIIRFLMVSEVAWSQIDLPLFFILFTFSGSRMTPPPVATTRRSGVQTRFIIALSIERKTSQPFLATISLMLIPASTTNRSSVSTNGRSSLSASLLPTEDLPVQR